jgi:DNA-binding transcriptional LysR family regulator
MDTKFLESFVSVAANGSIAEAARKLNLTSTAVAQRIRALEEETQRDSILGARARELLGPSDVSV